MIDSYNQNSYPDILDMIEMEERAKNRKKGILSPNEIENKKELIKINLLLGNYVSQSDLCFFAKYADKMEILNLDRLFNGVITAASQKTVSKGKNHGYSEGYKSEVNCINGNNQMLMIPTTTPDINIDSYSTVKIHSIADVLQNNMHEDFSKAAKYIVETYSEEIISELNEKNVIGITMEDCKYIRTESSCNQSLYDFKVDVLINIGVRLMILSDAFDHGVPTIHFKKRRLCYRLRYSFDFIGKTGKRTCSGPIGIPEALLPDDDISKQSDWKATEYLRPILWKKDFPKLVLKFLQDIYPEALETPTTIDGEQLVERMSDWLEGKYSSLRLRLREEWLGENGVRGMIYFSDATIRDGGGDRIRIKPGDIVINMDYVERESDRNATIIHECMHVYQHLPFFLLQMMAGNVQYGYVDRISQIGEHHLSRSEKDHLRWMEWQAEKLTSYIMMEEYTLRREIENLLKQQNNSRTSETMMWIMKQLSAKYGTSYQMSKIRMIEAGLREAEGIWNFVDGNKRIPNFSLSRNAKAGVVYAIGQRESIELYQNSKEYARIIDSCRYVYVDGHYVLNESKYIRTTSNYRHYLTPYAKNHIDECSLSFRINRSKGQNEYYFGAAARTDKKKEIYNKGYELYAEPGTKERERENTAYAQSSDIWCNLINSFTEDVHESVNIAMKAMGITQEAMAASLGIARKTLNKWLDTKRMPTNRIVAICVVLGMRMDVSLELISIADRPLRRSGVDAIFRSMISMPGSISIQRCNEILIENGYEPLTEGKSFDEI